MMTQVWKFVQTNLKQLFKEILFLLFFVSLLQRNQPEW